MSAPTHILLESKGRPGASASGGFDGRGGSNWRGGDGQRGGDAGPAQAGEAAGSVELWLSSGVAGGGGAPHVRVQAASRWNGNVDTTFDARETPSIALDVRGGPGGHGGRGGSGGAGGRGYHGSSATRYSSGTNGGPGGDGGDGGYGSHGAP